MIYGKTGAKKTGVLPAFTTKPLQFWKKEYKTVAVAGEWRKE